MTGQIGSNIVALVALTGLLGLIPMMVVCVTSFAKISVVLFLVRNALGIQQTPPNLVLYAVSIILSFYVMAPVLTNVYSVVTDPRTSYASVADWERVASDAVAPVRRFLDRHATPESRVFFVESTRKLWEQQPRGGVQDNDLVILMALGMQMMSPTVVSTPFKLLLFVSVDGWRRLLEGLILSYAAV